MFMKMKRLTAFALALAAAFAIAGAPAEEEWNSSELEGYVLEMVEGGFLLEDVHRGQVVCNVDEQTALEGLPAEEGLAAGMYVLVETDGRLTRSIPPQTHADRIVSYRLEGVVVCDEGEGVVRIDTPELGEILAYRESADKPLYPGVPITVYFDGVMALSEPARIAVRETIVPELKGVVGELEGDLLVLKGDDDQEYRVRLDADTVLGSVLPAETESAASDETAETPAPSREPADEPEKDEKQSGEEPAGEPENTPTIQVGDRVTVYYNGEWTDEESFECLALEITIQKEQEERLP